ADDHPLAPIYQQRLAEAHHNLGAAAQLNGKLKDAEGRHRQAVDLLAGLAEQHPEVPDYRHLYAVASRDLGIVLRDGQTPGAEKSYRKAAELLEDLAKDDPDNPVYWADLIAPYSNLVSLLTAEGSPNEEIGKCWARLADLMRKLAAGSPKDAEQQSQTGLTLS